jgi:hypothetical protein
MLFFVKNLRVGGRIILKWFFEKGDGFSGLMYGAVEGVS